MKSLVQSLVREVVARVKVETEAAGKQGRLLKTMGIIDLFAGKGRLMGIIDIVNQHGCNGVNLWNDSQPGPEVLQANGGDVPG